MALYQVLYWQEFPSQLKVWDDFDELKVDLGPAMADKIDRAAQARGLTSGDAYIAELKWSDEQERPGEPAEVAEALKREFEGKFL